MTPSQPFMRRVSGGYHHSLGVPPTPHLAPPRHTNPYSRRPTRSSSSSAIGSAPSVPRGGFPLGISSRPDSAHQARQEPTRRRPASRDLAPAPKRGKPYAAPPPERTRHARPPPVSHEAVIAKALRLPGYGAISGPVPETASSLGHPRPPPPDRALSPRPPRHHAGSSHAADRSRSTVTRSRPIQPPTRRP